MDHFFTTSKLVLLKFLPHHTCSSCSRTSPPDSYQNSCYSQQYFIHCLHFFPTQSSLAPCCFPTDSHRCWSFKMRLTTRVLSILGSELVTALCLWLGTEGKVGLPVSLWTMWEIMRSWVLSKRGKTSSHPVWLHPNKASYTLLAIPVSCLQPDCPSVFNLISDVLLNEHRILALLSLN